MSSLIPLSSARWSFRQLASSARWYPATVPGCVHKDLLANGLIEDPFHGTNELKLRWIEEKDWEYRCVFTVAKSLLDEERLDLVAAGLDTLATVTLNGHLIGRSDNMFIAHRWDVAAALKAGRNELRIRFDSALRFVKSQRQEHKAPLEFNDPVGGGTRLRKQYCQFGWDWAPRLLTAGVWLPLHLEAGPRTRLDSVKVTQDHHPDGSVSVFLTPSLTGIDRAAAQGLRLRAALVLNGAVVSTAISELPAAASGVTKSRVTASSIEAFGAKGDGDSVELPVRKPQLWWPAGQGTQPLYTARCELLDAQGRVLDVWEKRLGLRSIRLDRHPDQWGESFQFVVNGRPVFIKGANWIPAHSFVAGLTREDYERDLQAAVDANMNGVRVWGGGIYEAEVFYDLCDELGLLVWQDFMFACDLYPGDQAFLDSVALEARQQVHRLHHRACLALWCGNNEIAQLNARFLDQGAQREHYDALFHRLLPDTVKAFDGVTDYWPSSAWGGRMGFGHEDGEKQGDTHFWDVWHARKPVSDYEKWHFRFCSEFGMQSYCSKETLAAFCPPEDRNLFGPSAENHQKNPSGNQIILDYVTRRYGMPVNQDALIYLSQLNQAYCMQVAVEHYRRNRPRCMGAIYWQLNDCWPVASWSSIEHSGRWKALHFAARRFYAPALLSAQVAGDEKQGKGNYRESTHTGEVVLHTDYDAPEPLRALIRWELQHEDGRRLAHGRKAVLLKQGSAVAQLHLNFAKELAKHGRDRLLLRHWLEVEGCELSGDTAFFAQPRFLSLQKPKTKLAVELLDARQALVRIESNVFQHRVEVEVAGLPFAASDNFFELYPGVARLITLDFERPVALASLRKRLSSRSLYHAQNG